MRSVADDLRDELQEEVLRLSFEERMALALKLGKRGWSGWRSVRSIGWFAGRATVVAIGDAL